MKYGLVYTQRAQRDIRGVDPKVKKRIGKTLLRYLEEPLQYADK